MDQIWLASALWIGLALVASVASIYVTISVALVEIVVGAIAGNAIGLPLTPWVNYLAGFGAILLTFLAGAEIDPTVVRKHFWSSMSIGVVGFFAPYLGVLAFARFVLHWPWPEAQIAGISLSTTSVAVVYAVMVETGYNRTELGKIILAACFVNDLGTVLALGLIFANYNLWLALFVAVTAISLWLLPKFAPWFFERIGPRVSEPQTKFVAMVLFFLGGLASIAGSEAVLPAYLVGMVLAPTFLKDKELPHRMRVVAFTILTPFYFIKAGSLVEAKTVMTAGGLILAYLVSRGEDGDEILWHPPVDAIFPIRAARGDVYDPADVDGPHLRVHLGALRLHQPHHRSGAVHGPGHRRDRQRGGADADRAEMVSARLQAHHRGDMTL